MSNVVVPRLLTEGEAAAVLGVKPTTLTTWRATGRYPLRFVKCGRLVRYREEDVVAFIKQRMCGAVPDGE
jgi:excisionase family DNA binding protein